MYDKLKKKIYIYIYIIKFLGHILAIPETEYPFNYCTYLPLIKYGKKSLL